MPPTTAEIPAALRQAAQHHRAGRQDEAEAICRAVLQAQPANGDALFLLAGVSQARGRHDGAIDLLRRAIAIDPRRTEYHGNLGAVLGRLGRLDEAIACFRRVLALDARSVPGHIALGNALQAKGDIAGAVASFRQACAVKPDDAISHFNLGCGLRTAGELEAAAASLQTAARLAPRLADAQHNLGVVRFLQGRLDDAEAAFRAALAARPDYAMARRQLALVLIAAGRLEEASAFIMAPVRSERALDAPASGESFRWANATKLRHDADQLAHLLAAGRVDVGYGAVIEACRTLATQAGGVVGARIDVAAQGAAALRDRYNRLIHYRDSPALPAGALGDWDATAVEAAFRARDPRLASLDNFLAPAALEELRRFCLESTIWFQMTFENEVSATLFNGFCCPLLLQIGNELRQRLPGLLGDKPLTLAWAYKYRGAFSGLGAHADDGAVSVNFWITPDAANLDPERGGLLLWDRKLPESYLRRDRATQRQMIQEIVDAPDSEPAVVPYRCNRAVLFDSLILHGTDRFNFKDGYENRRLNVTLLYGRSD